MLKKGNPAAGIIFIVTIAAFAIFLLIVGYMGNTIAVELKEKMGDDYASVNKSFDTTITTSTVTINTLWYILFAGMLLGLIVQAMLIQQYPKVMVPIFILTLIVSVIVAIVLSNTYNALVENATLATASAHQTGIRFIMDKLPYLAVITGLIAIVIIFTRDESQGGGGAIIN